MPDPVVDVRSEPQAHRHQVIFGTYEQLTPGSAFELVNDHDPQRLRQQFEAEHGGEFSWKHLEEGPEVWRVRIVRLV